MIPRTQVLEGEFLPAGEADPVHAAGAEVALLADAGGWRLRPDAATRRRWAAMIFTSAVLVADAASGHTILA